MVFRTDRNGKNQRTPTLARPRGNRTTVAAFLASAKDKTSRNLVAYRWRVRSTAVLVACLSCSAQGELAKLEAAPPRQKSAPNGEDRALVPPVETRAQARSIDDPALADLGSFRSRVMVEFIDGNSCMGLIRALDVSPSGAAWVVGSCSLRFRVDAAGKLADYRAPQRSKKFTIGSFHGACNTTAAFSGVFARSEQAVYVVGDTRCGQDPNTIWCRPLEMFNGKKWNTTNVTSSKRVHEGIPWDLAGNDDLLYTLVEGDDWHGPPECAVHRLTKGGWGEPELVCPQPNGSTERVVTMKSLDVATDGTVWVVGTVYRNRTEMRNGAPVHGVAWTRDKNQGHWTEIRIEDGELSSISVSADGAVFAAGRSVWKLDDGRFSRISDQGELVDSLWAQSSERVWFARGGAPFVWTGRSATAVGIDATEAMVRIIHGSNSQVWAASANQVWQLLKVEDTTPPTKLVITQPE